MQISNLVSQYHNNLASGSEISTGTKGVEQLTRTLASLQKGQIFEGTVNSVKGNTVVLGLSSGQNITARLDNGISLSQGQSVFFQVKSNEDGLIAIKPMTESTNPTLLTALDAAGLSVNEKNLSMVNTMMQQQMSIDSGSLASMAKVISSNSGVDISTLVEMVKMDLPITDDMVNVYGNFKSHQGDLMSTVNSLAGELPQMASGLDNESAIEVSQQLNEILTSNLSEEAETSPAAFNPAEDPAFLTSGQPVESPEERVSLTAGNDLAQADAFVVESQSADSRMTTPTPTNAQMPSMNPSMGETIDNQPENPSVLTNETETVLPTAAQLTQSTQPVNTLDTILTREEYQELNDLIHSDPQIMTSHPELFNEEGNLKPQAQTAQVFSALTEWVASDSNQAASKLNDLTATKALTQMIQNLVEQNYTVKPEELTDKDKLSDLYDRLNRDLSHLSNLAETIGDKGERLSASVNQIHDNIEFMNQVNQTVSYVQIPLKMSGQNANGDLYVYTNRKSHLSKDEEITAFLHFDLEHLGSTDISVRLKNKNVDTKFYLEDAASFDLIVNNLPLLEDRLKAKGYNCKFNVETTDSEPDFVSEIIAKSAQTSPQASMMRYSFDVRA